MKPGTPIAEGQDPRRVSIAGLSQRPLHIAPQYARELVSWRVTLGRMLPQCFPEEPRDGLTPAKSLKRLALPTGFEPVF